MNHPVPTVATQPVCIGIGSLRYSRFLARVSKHRHAHRRDLLVLSAAGAGTVIRNLAMRQDY